MCSISLLNEELVVMSLITLSGNRTIDSLLVLTRWGGTNTNTAASLTYSHPEGIDTEWKTGYLLNEPSGFSALSTTQYTYFKQALNLWAEVAGLNFTEVADNQTTHGDIRIAFTTIVDQEPNTAAWAYVPTDFGVLEEAGDVWLGTSLTDLQPETFGFSTLLHELGHALGLKHPFDNQSNNTNTLSNAEDSTQYTVMSYTNYEGAGNVYSTTNGVNFTIKSVEPTTPMLYDIQAIQYIYGENLSSHTGDDTYTFSNTQGELKTIWDTGGIDTFDLSNQSLAMNIDLNAGNFSSLGVKKTSINGPLSAAEDNIAIAFNTVIENAIGGSFNDTIIGNSADNSFTGGAGNDVISGNAGRDTAIYSGDFASYTISLLNSSTLQVNGLNNNEGIDTLNSIEVLKFQDQTISASRFFTTEINPTNSVEVLKNTTEGNTNHFNYFLLELSAAITTDASITYRTQDGTALAGQDYIATSGTATIVAGQSFVSIPIEIIADTIAENTETFFLLISNPQGGIFPVGTDEISASHSIIDDDGANAQIVGVNNIVEI
jgi:serralysin